MNTAELHTEFEKRSPHGVGAALDLKLIEPLAKTEIGKLNSPMPGINQQIPLPLSNTIQAGFNVNGSSLTFDAVAHAISLDLDVWLHTAKKPTDRIMTFSYSLRQEPVDVDLNQSTLAVTFTPISAAGIAPSNTVRDPSADQRLIDAGYVTPTGAADWNRFNNEVGYPFVWNVAQGLTRSVIRSLPVPQPISALGVIRPVIPINAAFVEDYLLIWSERATAIIPDCGASPSPLTPSRQSWRLRPGSPAPSSPFDTARPPFAVYVAGDPILNWHSGVLKPAVLISQSGGSVVSWRFDAAIGLDTLLVELVPAANGGSIEANAGLKVVGVASAWLNLPCGPVGLISASIQGDASANGSLTVGYDSKSHKITADLAVKAAVDGRTVKISTGGIFGSVIADLISWLIYLGVINIATQFNERADTVIWDAGQMDSTGKYTFNPSTRVGDGSALIAMFPKDMERSEP